MRLGVWVLVTVGVIAVACSSSYSEAPPVEPDGGRASASSSSASSSSGAGGEAGVGDDDDDVDAGPKFGLACPVCAEGETCFAAGCDGLAPATCEAPRAVNVDVNESVTYSVYVCAKASTAMSCARNEADGGLLRPFQIAAAFALGTGKWHVDATGSTPRLSTGSCAQNSLCNGDSAKARLAYDVNDPDKTFDGPTTLTVSTGSPNATCQQFAVKFTRR